MLRSDYNLMAAALKKVSKGNARLTQSDLILIRAIDANSTNYRFPVLENEAAILFPEEVRLNINDLFGVTHTGVFLGCRQGTKETKVTDAPLQLYPYVPMELSPRLVQLKHLYSGYMKIDVNKVNYVDKWNLRKHEYIPQTQFQSRESTLVSIPPFPDFTAVLQAPHQPNIDYKSDGIFPVCPNIVLSGAKKNDVQIFLPHAIAPDMCSWFVKENEQIDTAFMYVVVVIRGYLAQNAAKFQQ